MKDDIKPNGTAKIEKGIPIPARRGGPGAPFKYPWTIMKVGDSFLMGVHRQQTTGANKNYAPKRFESRAVPGGKRRVWRVA